MPPKRKKSTVQDNQQSKRKKSTNQQADNSPDNLPPVDTQTIVTEVIKTLEQKGVILNTNVRDATPVNESSNHGSEITSQIQAALMSDNTVNTTGTNNATIHKDKPINTLDASSMQAYEIYLGALVTDKLKSAIWADEFVELYQLLPNQSST
ncbi:uncharacterized protein LOC123560405 [Mercenaria mercenaria]|uniref:uncharacterized protein LOC123560405 n=1 Tax=Mercenaria mercenaria TaxID=6596 RepID=UPI00234F6AD4|nr:uncharacterized protein LOC123560405 [Mercenaria mercenaria]